MIYKVKAKIIEDTIGEFYRKLADGTVAKQRPDGEEITASMKRAAPTAPGVAEWYEKCFCPTSLYHERQTQYDFYLTPEKLGSSLSFDTFLTIPFGATDPACFPSSMSYFTHAVRTLSAPNFLSTVKQG